MNMPYLFANLAGISCLLSYGFSDHCPPRDECKPKNECKPKEECKPDCKPKEECRPVKECRPLDPCDFATKYSGVDVNLGFDVSAGVGFAGVRADFERTFGANKSHKTLGSHGVAVQLKIGGTYGFANRWIVGIETYGQYNSGKSESHSPFEGGVIHHRDFKLPWNIGIDLRVGYIFWPSNMIYVYGGPDWGYFDFDYSNEAGLHQSFTGFELGGRLGAGVEQMFNSHWVMKTTFDYTWYPEQQYDHAAEHHHEVLVRLATFLFSIGYLF